MRKGIGQWMGSLLETIMVPILSIALGLLVGTLFILVAGADPVEAYSALFRAVAGSPRAIGETLVATTPLIFTGLAVALAFRCGLFNIGVEGQYMVALLASALAGYYLHLPRGIHALVTLAAGALAGAIWAAIVGILKAYRGVHEVINSIMLNYIALYFTHYLLMYYFREPSNRAAATPYILETARLTSGLIPGSRLHTGIFIALAAAFFVWFFLWKTPAGYEIRAVGHSPGAAEYAGINVKKNIILAMVLSGALSGLAGAVQTQGVMFKFYEQMGFIGYGFDGIAVALLGRNHPMGVIFGALLFGALTQGSGSMQAVAGVPKTVVWIVQGTVVFFVAAENIFKYLRRRRVKAEVKTA
ncbi:MAG TPA: ABC transporter permease [Symbiobacteriaceae bacterium]